jgi:hypothetical protein
MRGGIRVDAARFGDVLTDLLPQFVAGTCRPTGKQDAIAPHDPHHNFDTAYWTNLNIHRALTTPENELSWHIAACRYPSGCDARQKLPTTNCNVLLWPILVSLRMWEIMRIHCAERFFL